MPGAQHDTSSASQMVPGTQLVLGIDTCGPTGSVALAHLSETGVEMLVQTMLEGRTYSATLISSMSGLLQQYGLALHQVSCIVVVSGPGSFTGVRVGLSAAKGLAEGAGLPLLAVSRLAVLAHKAGVPDAALDAHRHEVFLRLHEREGLAGRAELAAESAPPSIAVADDAAMVLITAAWPNAQIVRMEPPSAADAIHYAEPRLKDRSYDDPILLDGHYLRRSDAEIFGSTGARP
jgi:tRNA threonylcarbamoyladenosine biosynthesis protein TsaB